MTGTMKINSEATVQVEDHSKNDENVEAQILSETLASLRIVNEGAGKMELLRFRLLSAIM